MVRELFADDSTSVQPHAALLELTAQATVGESGVNRQVCRWADADKPARALGDDCHPTQLDNHAAAGSLTYEELRQTLQDAESTSPWCG